MTARPFGWIYRITAPNGKAYIGQTIQHPRKRIADHFSKARNGKPHTRLLTAAIRKYGKLCRAEILASAKTQKTLDELERKMITQHNTLAPNGLNLTTGGLACQLTADSINECKRKQKLRRDDEKHRRL